MKITRKSNVAASTVPVDASAKSNYDQAIEYIKSAIDCLGKEAKTSVVAKDSIANLGVVLFDIKGSTQDILDNPTYTFTVEDFENENQWEAFKKYVNRMFVNARNPKYNEVVKEFTPNHITFYEINDPDIERTFEDIKDLAKDEN